MIALTLVIGFVAGFILRRIGLAAGGLLGPFLAVGAFSAITGEAYLPGEARIIVQVVAGAFVGCSIGRDELRNLSLISKAAGFMIAWHLALVLLLGFLMAAATSTSLPTALMSCVPGGISDIPIVAADMGANAPDVTILQLLRLFLGIGLLSLTTALSKRQLAPSVAPLETPTPNMPSGLVPELGDAASRIDLPDPSFTHEARWRLALKTAATLAVAMLGGVLGQATGIPGMTFTIAIACVLVFNLATGFVFVPRWLKRLCQYGAGSYLGAQVTASTIAGLPGLLVPAFIVVTGYIASYFGLSAAERRLFHFSKTESRLIATPAGASDMALVLEDAGLVSPQVIVLQIVRLIAVLALFPQVVNLVLLAVSTVSG